MITFDKLGEVLGLSEAQAAHSASGASKRPLGDSESHGKKLLATAVQYHYGLCVTHAC